MPEQIVKNVLSIKFRLCSTQKKIFGSRENTLDKKITKLVLLSPIMCTIMFQVLGQTCLGK